MHDEKSNIVWAFVALALIVGVGAGYFFGHARGKTDLLAEQKADEDMALKAAQKKILKQPQPF